MILKFVIVGVVMPFCAAKKKALSVLHLKLADWVPIKGLTGDPTIKKHMWAVAGRIMKKSLTEELSALAPAEGEAVFAPWMEDAAQALWADLDADFQPPRAAPTDAPAPLPACQIDIEHQADEETGPKMSLAEIKQKGFERFLKDARAKHSSKKLKWEAVRKLCRAEWSALSADEVIKYVELWQEEQTTQIEQGAMVDCQAQIKKIVAEKTKRAGLSEKEWAIVGKTVAAAIDKQAQPEKKNGCTAKQAALQNIVVEAANELGGHKKIQSQLIKVAHLSVRQKRAYNLDPVVYVAKPRQFVGRPCDRFSTQELQDMLAPFCDVSCRFSARMENQFMQLMGSVMATWEQNQKLRDAYSYRTLCQKLAGGRAGVIHYTEGWSDCCVICMAWDSCMHKQIAKLLESVRCACKSLKDDFWEDFVEIEEENSWQCGKLICDSEEFIKQYMKFAQAKLCDLQEHSDSALDQVAITTAKLSLDEVVHNFDIGPEPEDDEERIDYYTLIREFQLHFEKRDRIWAVLRNWQVNPRPRCGYLWIDWMKVSFGTVDPKRVKANMENSVLTKKLSLSGGPSICP